MKNLYLLFFAMSLFAFSNIKAQGLNTVNISSGYAGATVTLEIEGFNTLWTGNTPTAYMVNVASDTISATNVSVIYDSLIQATFTIPCDFEMDNYLDVVTKDASAGFLSLQDWFYLYGFSVSSGGYDDDGNCTGYAYMQVQGGQAPVNFWWDFGPTTDYVYDLCAGTYTGAVTDFNGCTDSVSVTLLLDSCVNFGINMAPVFGESSIGACDGYTEAWVNTNYYPATYSWSSGGTNQSDSSLCAGNQWVTITDGIGCSDTTYFFVDSIFNPCVGFEAGVWNVINTSSDTTCTGSALGGAFYYEAPLSYSWSTGGSTTENATNLCFGNQYLAVTDVNACTDTMFFYVDSVFNACNYFFPYINTIQQATDTIACNGSLTVYPDGGTAPYSYSWSNASTSDTISSLCPGVYSITVTDANGCVKTDSVAIEFQCSLDLSGSIVNDVSCFGLNDGSVTIVSATGPSNLIYTIDDGTTITSTPDFSGLAPGSYMLMSQDSITECYGEYAITINEPSLFVIDSSFYTTNVSCYGGNDAMIAIGASGGTMPYSYQWSNGQSGDTLANVAAGTHTVFITDASGCVVSATDSSITQPAPMSLTTSMTMPTCGASDGSIQVTGVTGGTAPYFYSWTSGDTSATASNLDAGVYMITVTDANGCSVTETMNLSSSTAPAVTVNTTSPSCNGGTDAMIDLVVTGGTAPITFDWSNGAQTEDISNVMAGIYDVTIEDGSGCVISQIITIPSTPKINLTNVTMTPASCGFTDGDITVNPTGGSAPYLYSWSSGGSAATESGIGSGTYTVTVTDNNGCVKSKTYALSNDAAPVITVDQVIQPACEGGNGLISVSISGGTAPYSYLWSDGSTGEDLISAVVGNYQLTVTDAGNCQGVAYAELTGINLNAAEICLVTVDTITNGNIVVWTKDYNLGIAEYEIYRETAIFNQFQYLGTVPFNDLSQYVDETANPEVHSYKYKVRTIDSCENASDFLALHKTIHLNAELNVSNEIELSWDDYIGMTYNEFEVHRYHPSTGWEVIANLPTTTHNYTDASYPSVIGLGYSIVVVPDSPCTAEKAQDHNSTRSNKVTIAPAGGDPSGIENANFEFNVYPNPGNEFVTLRTTLTEEYQIAIYDIRGRKVYATTTNGNITVDTQSFDSGVYFIEFLTANQETGVVKWIKK